MMAEADFYSYPQSLGRPIPLDEHAVSVSLPTWADVVGYEEGEKRVTDCMQIGYPRFKVHACIEKLIEIMKMRYNIDSNRYECILLPSLSTATSFVKFLGEKICEATVVEVGYGNIRCVFFPTSVKGLGRKFWQHTGEIISSRLAEDALLAMSSPHSNSHSHSHSDGSNSGSNNSNNSGNNHNGGGDWGVTAKHNTEGLRYSASDAHMMEYNLNKNMNINSPVKNINTSTNMSVSTSGKRNRDDMQTQQSSNKTTEKETGLDTILHTIKSRISSIVHEKEEQITVCVSGMASIYAALKCVQELGRQSGNTMGGIVVFGFPYLDTLKVSK